MKTLITPSQAVALAFTDGEYLSAGIFTETDIAAVELRHIVPVIGRALYEKLLDGLYPAFATEYLAPCIALFTRLAVQSRLDIRTDRCGTTAPRSTWTQPAGNDSLRRLRQELRTQARALRRRASEYLEAHPRDFPEYDPAGNILNRCSVAGNLVQVSPR